ncbi:MAG: TrlF family AAA-like ATPase [Terriglobales bacterium]|jgi:ABC-type Mn2+/Zn2+ transport system ATPase subunit/predicted metal-dependent phosphoesterase TrpH
MPTPADDIAKLSAGARFFRADLHIHSFGGSHDVKDSSMTPAGIVATAIAERLSLIAVTDHNEITNVEETIKAAAGKSPLVVPGVELTTPQGHLLVYFETFASLEKFWGKLDLADRGTQNSRCQTSMLDCLRLAESQSGSAILAHVDAAGGLEDKLPGHDSHKKDIFCAPALIGFEVKSATAPMTYSTDDQDPERAALGRLRQTSLGLGEKQFLARVMFSDSHTLATLGKNAQGAKRLTRVKMDTPSFHGLRVAMQDADARIRLEDEIPVSVPYVMGVKIDGGFLDGQSMHFSRNLNCIIGGRGAGKSTAFECVRVVAPGESESKLLDSEIWPDTLHIVWVDEAGSQHTVERRIENRPVNLDDPDYGLTKFSIESYGQGETAHTSSKARQDSGSLLEYLDKFIPIGVLREADDDIRQRLLQNQSNIEKAEIEVNKIPYFKQVLDVTQKQLLALEKARAKEVVALERKVAEERSLREQIDRKILSIAMSIKASALSEQAGSIKSLAKAEDLEVGKEQFKQIVSLLDGFAENLKKAEQSSSKEVDELAKSVKGQVEIWRAQEQGVVNTIEQKRKELAAQGVKLDLANIRKLANDEAEYQKALTTLAEWEKNLRSQHSGRLDLLKERRTVLSEITALRKAYGVKSTKALEGTLGDLTVSVKFTEGALSQEGAEIIQEAMDWRTAQVPRAALITENVTVSALLEALAKNDPTALTELEASPGVKLFSRNEALEILKRLGQTPYKFKLERCVVEDRPKITVTKKITTGGTARFVPKDFSKLSMGQQQSVLLALMLSSDSKFPLIIDQPEDNLDGEFIFHSLVPVLRKAKERRQIIVVTHNANIAVLGDAEQIIALKSTSDKSSIVASGSIDDFATRKACCQILEGSEEAFKRRARIYGVTS